MSEEKIKTLKAELFDLIEQRNELQKQIKEKYIELNKLREG